MKSLMELVAEWEQKKQEPEITPILDGHKVCRIIWKGNNATILTDEQGHYWRYLESYGKAWPVIVMGREQ